jgi:2-polyprenyl-3-methyl-5-hydroxy-6-metoxy-1,4-benzoquinol methylase
MCFPVTGAGTAGLVPFAGGVRGVDCAVHSEIPATPSSSASKEDNVASASSFRFLKLVTAPLKALTRSSPRLNAASWDLQYRLGLWDYLDAGETSGRELAEIIEKYVPQARILDLGCGTSVNLPLAPGMYRRYHGVDISAKAIKQARMTGRPHATYETADILTYAPQETYDAILLREVIYYLPVTKVSGFLDRLSGFLAPAGVIVIQVWTGERNPDLIAAIEASTLPVMLEKALEADPGHPTVYLLGKSGSDFQAPASA